MKLSTPVAILMGFALLAATLFAAAPRYQILQADSGEMVRMHLRSGQTTVCSPNDRGNHLDYPCAAR